MDAAEPMKISLINRAGVLLLTCFLAGSAWLYAWQRFGGPFGFRESPVPDEWFDADGQGEFHFTRFVYTGLGGQDWGRRGGWATDYPEADYHFMQGVGRLTNIDSATGSRLVRPLDEELFEYPWLYGVEVGRWHLDEEDAARLREYLLRGGFLVVDDFHGTYQWAMFLVSMRRVFPERPILDIEEEDPLLHVLYDLDQRIQVPGIQYVWSGSTYEYDGFEPRWRGIYDDENRLMVAINFNMDLGDAWEHADTPQYPEKMTALAYRFGINYVIYSMTH